MLIQYNSIAVQYLYFYIVSSVKGVTSSRFSSTISDNDENVCTLPPPFLKELNWNSITSTIFVRNDTS